MEQGGSGVDDGDEALVERQAVLTIEGDGEGRSEDASRASDPEYGSVYRITIC